MLTQGRIVLVIKIKNICLVEHSEMRIISFHVSPLRRIWSYTPVPASPAHKNANK